MAKRGMRLGLGIGLASRRGGGATFKQEFDLTAGSLPVGMTFARASVATYYDAAGVLQTATSGSPRFDHDPVTLEPLGILMEEESQNICLRSSEFTTQPPWVSPNTRAANVSTSPSGAMDADRVTLGNENFSGYDIFQAFSGLSPGRTYVFSVWVRLGTATNFCIVPNDQTGWNTIGGQSFGAADGVTNSAWTRVSFSFAAPSTGNINLHLGHHGQTGVTAQSLGTVFLWGAQLELDSLSSYIPTTSAAVWREADDLRADVPDGGYNITVTDAAGSEIRSKAGAYHGYHLEPRSGQRHIQSAAFKGVSIGSLHPAAADIIQRGGISGVSKTRMNEFVKVVVARGLWDRMTHIPDDSDFAAGHPFGGGGWPTNASGAGNRTNYRWTPVGASFASGGTVLSKTVGSKQTQYIRSRWTFNPALNPMYGTLTRTTQAPASPSVGYYDSVGTAMTTLQSVAGIGRLGFSSQQSGSDGSGLSPIYNAPLIPQGSDGYNASGVPELSAGLANAAPCSPTLLLARRDTGTKSEVAVWNSIRGVQDVANNFSAFAREPLDQVGPVYSGTSTGIQIGSFWFWGTKAEIEALPLHELYDILATTLLYTGDPHLIINLRGQSNADHKMTYALAHRSVGFGASTRTFRCATHNIGGNPIANWEVDPIINNGIGHEVADRQANSDNAYNSPIRGVNYQADMVVFQANLPVHPLVRSRCRIVDCAFLGESDSENRYEALRYPTTYETWLDFFDEDFADFTVNHILMVIDYDPPARTGAGNGFTLSGFTGAATGGNGDYTMTAASGESDYAVAYVWTKGTWTVTRNGTSGAWELKNSGAVVSSSVETDVLHPELATTPWTVGGTPAYSETRYCGNVEWVRKAIVDKAAANPATMRAVSTRTYDRPDDNVHCYLSDTSRGQYAADVSAAILDLLP